MSVEADVEVEICFSAARRVSLGGEFPQPENMAAYKTAETCIGKSSDAAIAHWQEEVRLAGTEVVQLNYITAPWKMKWDGVANQRGKNTLAPGDLLSITHTHGQGGHETLMVTYEVQGLTSPRAHWSRKRGADALDLKLVGSTPRKKYCKKFDYEEDTPKRTQTRALDKVTKQELLNILDRPSAAVINAAVLAPQQPPVPQEPKDGKVYLAKEVWAGGWYKIGSSYSAEDRRRQFQCGNLRPIVMIAESKRDLKERKQVEYRLHAKYAANHEYWEAVEDSHGKLVPRRVRPGAVANGQHGIRGRGGTEWFSFTEDELPGVIEAIEEEDD